MLSDVVIVAAATSGASGFSTQQNLIPTITDITTKYSEKSIGLNSMVASGVTCAAAMDLSHGNAAGAASLAAQASKATEGIS